MNIKQCYELLGGNYEEALNRLMTDGLIGRLILKFPQDPSMLLFRDSLESGNYDDAFRAAHTLKGVAGNLSFSALQASASEVTEALRAEKKAPDVALVQKLEEDYERVIEALERYQNER